MAAPPGRMRVSIDNFESSAARIDSPRTLEAIFALGIDVHDLYPKTELDMLPAAGYKKHIATVLASHYEARRLIFISEVRDKRIELARGVGSPTLKATRLGATAVPHDGTIGIGGSTSRADSLRLEATEKEHKRAEFAKQKQQQEMATMVESEVKLARLAEEAARKEREARAVEAAGKRAREAERKKQAEERRKADMAKKEEADARVEKMRALAAAAFAAEGKHAEEAALEQKALLMSRRLDEDESRRAKMEAERKREEDMEAQAAALAARLKDWEAKEAVRVAKMEESRARLRAEAEAKADAAALRLDAALTRDVEKIVAKRHHYTARIREAEQRHGEKEAAEAEVLRKRAAARAAKQSKMRDALLRTRAEEQAWIDKLAAAAAREDGVLAKVRDEAAAGASERAAAAALHAYEHRDALRRSKKRDEYERMHKLVDVFAAEKVHAEAEAERARQQRDRQVHQKKMLLLKSGAEQDLERMRTTSTFSASGLSALLAKAGISSGGGGGDESPRFRGGGPSRRDSKDGGLT